MAASDASGWWKSGGTSTAMIHRHYLHELDVRHELPEDFIFDGAVQAARRALRHLRAA